jgi:cell division protein FtsB
MFGLNKFAIAGIIFMSLIIAYLKYENNTLLQNVATEKANTQRLVDEIKESNKNIVLLKKTINNNQKISNDIAKANSEYRKEVDDLKSEIEDHDWMVLGTSKPGLIEKIINKGTEKLGRELENITKPLEN